MIIEEAKPMIKLGEEKGVVLITALLIMIVLALVGMAAIMHSSIEINFSRNERLGKTALFGADGGVQTVPTIIQYYALNKPQSFAAVTPNLQAIMTNTNNNFLNIVMGFATHSASDTPATNPDVTMNIQGSQANILISRVFAQQFQGGAAEANAGYEGAESGGGGGSGMAIYYRADSLGQTNQKTNSTVEIVYRLIY